MSDYSVTGNPISLSRGASSLIRVEFGLIQTAIATKVDVTGDTYTGTHNFTGATVNVATPTTAAEPATKGYVDASMTPTGSVAVWVTGTTYAYGYEVFSPIDFQTYRRKVAGAGSIDPSADTTNWSPVNLFSSGIIITAGAVREHKSAIAASAIDISLANYFTKTITATTTFTVSNVTTTGTVSSFILDLTNGGSQTINWWSGVKWASATAPTLTTSGRDVLGFFTHDGGTVWTGMLLTKDAR